MEWWLRGGVGGLRRGGVWITVDFFWVVGGGKGGGGVVFIPHGNNLGGRFDEEETRVAEDEEIGRTFLVGWLRGREEKGGKGDLF